MRDLPQELIDIIIDKLAEDACPSISNYSTVSRKWVNRTQEHHFNRVWFGKWDRMWKWYDTIGVDPFGLSRHVRHLKLDSNSMLGDFREILCALTHVQEVEILKCNIFCSPSCPSPLTLIGSSLVRLDIDSVATRPYIMASLLASLPSLRKLFTLRIEVEWGDRPRNPFTMFHHQRTPIPRHHLPTFHSLGTPTPCTSRWWAGPQE